MPEGSASTESAAGRSEIHSPTSHDSMKQLNQRMECQAVLAAMDNADAVHLKCSQVRVTQLHTWQLTPTY